MHYPAQVLSYQKIVGQLQERSTGETVKHYLELFAGAFLIHLVYQFSTRPLTTRTSSPKIVPLAPALVHAFTAPKQVETNPEWRGHVFEACVGAALVRKEKGIFTWREKQLEMDYVIPHPKGPIGVEVKSGRRRAPSGATAFLAAFRSARVVTLTPESSLPLLRGEAQIEDLV
jgi:predicted AAA+ superfamily ATPase